MSLKGTVVFDTVRNATKLPLNVAKQTMQNSQWKEITIRRDVLVGSHESPSNKMKNNE